MSTDLKALAKDIYDRSNKLADSCQRTRFRRAEIGKHGRDERYFLRTYIENMTRQRRRRGRDIIVRTG